jgi:crotonobetainyl-CoA:carnitine CoA-transferase CaiB-like acyl-CoA transferase
MAPHGIYPCAGEDAWVAIACRDEADWRRLALVIADPWTEHRAYADLEGRLANQDALDEHVAAWTAERDKFEAQRVLRAACVPCSAVQMPGERVDHDPDTEGLWPTVTHTAMGEVRIDGLPARFSETPWRMTRGAPCLGEHNEAVLGRLLGLSPQEVADLHAEGVI